MKAKRMLLDPYQRALRNPKSLMLAIRAKCWHCEGAGADSGWQRRIRTCAVRDCPLWHVRPYQEGAAQSGGDDPVSNIAPGACFRGDRPDPLGTYHPHGDRSGIGPSRASHEQGMESGEGVEPASARRG